MYLSVEEFATQTAAERHLENLVLKLNDEHPALAVYDPPFDVVLDRFIADERLLEIKSIRPGERTEGVGELSYSTATGYLTNIKRIRGRWGTLPISRMKPMKIQEWLKGLDLAPKTTGDIKASCTACSRRRFYGSSSNGNGTRCNWSKSKGSANGASAL